MVLVDTRSPLNIERLRHELKQIADFHDFAAIAARLRPCDEACLELLIRASVVFLSRSSIRFSSKVGRRQNHAEGYDADVANDRIPEGAA